MAEALTDIFGTAIKVTAQPRQAKRQMLGYAGAHGMTSMNMGTRGRIITVVGRLVGSGSSYLLARANVQSVIDAIESYQSLDGASYTYAGQTYHYVVFEKFQLLNGSDGKAFHFTNEGKVTVNFIQILRSLL